MFGLLLKLLVQQVLQRWLKLSFQTRPALDFGLGLGKVLWNGHMFVTQVPSDIARAMPEVRDTSSPASTAFMRPLEVGGIKFQNLSRTVIFAPRTYDNMHMNSTLMISRGRHMRGIMSGGANGSGNSSIPTDSVFQVNGRREEFTFTVNESFDIFL